MAFIRIKNLKLRAVIGINDWERENKQDVIVNIKLEFDASAAAKSDDIADTVAWVASRPDHVQVAEVIIMPTAQASASVTHKKTD